jgi:ribosomal protein L3 glutamine methyltransferase
MLAEYEKNSRTPAKIGKIAAQRHMGKNMADLTELHTIRDMIRWAISRFNESGLYYGHGTDSSWDEALTLVLRGLHLPHDINPELLKANITTAEREHLQKLIERRIHERIPVAYLIHEAWFAGLPFYVDERVLVPRSPIAELIEHEFQPWLQIDKVTTILDLCTGSGCIAIACAKAFSHIQVDASDISADALAVAKMNVLRYDIADQVHLFEADLFTQLPAKNTILLSVTRLMSMLSTWQRCHWNIIMNHDWV